jgi:prophage tail gpP-like protein
MVTKITVPVEVPSTGSAASSQVTQYTVPTRSQNATVPPDQATLIVGGINFQDWESVYVQMRWASSWSYFKFTSVERDAPTGNSSAPDVVTWFQDPVFLPGAPCEISLGGVPVIYGFVEVRQVAYDANRHGIEISGKSWSELAAKSSVDSDSGSFDGMTWKQVADKVVAPHGIKVIPIGNLDSTPFKQLQNQPGELIHDFLERIARPRGIILGNDSFGNFLAIGQHSMPVVNTQLIEGQNIKACQCIISKEHQYDEYRTTGQTPASDDINGSKASELKASFKGTGFPGTLKIIPSEQPVSQQELVARARNEFIWAEGPKIEASITVQGWFRDTTNLWYPGENVFVYSPMCPLNMMMKIETVTFTQDNNSGTQTILDLKQPWALNDDNLNPGAPNSTSNLSLSPAQALASGVAPL